MAPLKRKGGRRARRGATPAQKKKRKYMRDYMRDYYASENGRRRGLVAAARHRAKKKGWPFSITHEDVSLPDTCPLCNNPIDLAGGGRKTSPSIDRIDPARGYEPDNVWVVCDGCNTIKNNATLERFELMAYNWRRHIEERTKRVHGADGARHGVDPGAEPLVQRGGAGRHRRRIDRPPDQNGGS